MSIKQSLSTNVQTSELYEPLRGVQGLRGVSGPEGPSGPPGPPGPMGARGYLSLDTLSEFINNQPVLHFAAGSDKALKSRIGPSFTHSRLGTGTFTNVNGIIVGKTTGTTSALVPNTVTVGSDVTVTVPSGQVIGWDIGATVTLHTDSDGDDVLDTPEAWITGTIKSVNHTTLVLTVVSRSGSTTSTSSWTLGYRGPRFHHDFQNNVSGLLLETASATNLIVRSDDFGASEWNAGSQRNLTVAGNDAISPSGATDADRLTVGATATLYQVLQGLPFTGFLTLGTAYTVSCFFKPNQVTRVSIWAGTPATLPVDAIFDLTGSGSVVANAFGTASIQQYPNGWYRCIITGTAGATLNTSLRISPVSGTSRTYAGNSVDSFWAWGAQVEAGSSATSYIPTTTATVIRPADSCNITNGNAGFLYNPSEGALFIDCTPNTLTAGQGFYGLHDSPRSLGGFSGVSVSSGFDASSYGPEFSRTFGVVATAPASRRFKICQIYTSNSTAISINGSLVQSSSSYSPPAKITGIALGANGFSDGPSYSSILITDFKLYRKRISDDLMRVHTTL